MIKRQAGGTGLRCIRSFTSLVVVGALAAAGCGSQEDATPPTPTDATPATTPESASTAPTIEAPSISTPDAFTTASQPTPTDTTVPLDPTDFSNYETAWLQIDGGKFCACADSSKYRYWMKIADPNKVVFYLAGGGACFDAATCEFGSGGYDDTAEGRNTSDDPTLWRGIFDFGNPSNPFADYSFVVASYCTGDLHLGNKAHIYADNVVVRHNGYVNASTALESAAARFGEATEVVIAGSSAGSASAPVFAGLAADMFPDASITVVADSSGAYPSDPLVSSTLGSVWGSVIPEWPVNDSLTHADWGLPRMFIQAGLHAPRIQFAQFDHAYDQTQEFYARLAGLDATNMHLLIAQHAAEIEAAGVDVASYVAPGGEHSVLNNDQMYSLVVEGVPFVDWLAAVAADTTTAGDVICTTCQPETDS